MMIKNEMWKLNNGVEMPAIGIGTFQATKESLLLALESGYRHVDIAPIYGNEKEVGEAIVESGVPRSELFLSVKIWNESMRTGKIREAVESSLQNLHTDYLDLLLYHWPVKDKYLDTWKEMEKLYKEGIVRAIGVSNTTPRQLEEIKKIAEVKPVVDQIEMHPHFTQPDVVDYCKNNDIIIQTWSPLGRGAYVAAPTLTEIGKAYGKTAAQVVLKWNMQRGCCILPKASSKERLYENADLFDFTLSEEDMSRINAMNNGVRTESDPENFDF